MSKTVLNREEEISKLKKEIINLSEQLLDQRLKINELKAHIRAYEKREAKAASTRRLQS